MHTHTFRIPSPAGHRNLRWGVTLSPLFGALLRASYEPSSIFVAHRKNLRFTFSAATSTSRKVGLGLRLRLPPSTARSILARHVSVGCSDPPRSRQVADDQRRLLLL